MSSFLFLKFKTYKRLVYYTVLQKKNKALSQKRVELILAFGDLQNNNLLADFLDQFVQTGFSS